ncbi:SseB family protein [Streptomyces sp. NPDC050448]|uniref:SseB family protein n=1 Tax=Streptomyces sp. NPDC050448 TaxID=3155404 RepID=UPI00343537FB
MARTAALERLADFRSRAVLVPLDEQGGLWTAQLGGLDWICAFSDEEALARFTVARDEAEREWPYRRTTGARLLDEVIPAVDFPCGVALNAAGPGGAVFPPMRGIVPATAALDGEAAA